MKNVFLVLTIGFLNPISVLSTCAQDLLDLSKKSLPAIKSEPLSGFWSDVDRVFAVYRTLKFSSGRVVKDRVESQRNQNDQRHSDFFPKVGSTECELLVKYRSDAVRSKEFGFKVNSIVEIPTHSIEKLLEVDEQYFDVSKPLKNIDKISLVTSYWTFAPKKHNKQSLDSAQTIELADNVTRVLPVSLLCKKVAVNFDIQQYSWMEELKKVIGDDLIINTKTTP